MPRGNIKNLKPNSDRSPEELKKMARNGGIKSGKVRKEKKLMSQIMAEYLTREHDVQFGKIKKKMSGAEHINLVMLKVLEEGGSPAVSLMKVISEATEGSKIKLASDEAAPLNITITPVKVKE